MKVLLGTYILLSFFIKGFSVTPGDYVIYLKYENSFYQEGGEIFIYLKDFDKNYFNIIDSIPRNYIVDQFLYNNGSVLETDLKLESELCCGFGDIYIGYKKLTEIDSFAYSIIGDIDLQAVMDSYRKNKITLNKHEVYYYKIVKVDIDACECQRVMYKSSSLSYKSDKILYLKNINAVDKVKKNIQKDFRSLLEEILLTPD